MAAQTTICKWGNSLALRLPKHVADEARLVEGSTVEIDVEDGTLRVTPARKRFLLSELIADEPPRDKGSASPEADWGERRGDEVW